MKAREMIVGASYGPHTMKVLGQAFDEAWDSIAGNFGENLADIEQARVKLARQDGARGTRTRGCLLGTFAARWLCDHGRRKR